MSDGRSTPYPCNYLSKIIFDEKSIFGRISV